VAGPPYAVGAMTGSAQQQAAGNPRWQRFLLPGAMVGAPDGRRSPRDWMVDVVMFVLAVGCGALVLEQSWDDHSDLTAILDIVVGAIACLTLWVRRRFPVAVAVFSLTASVFSGLAAGPAIMATFNAAIRASSRALMGIVPLSFAGVVIFPLLYPGSDPYIEQLLIGSLVTGAVFGWGLFVRAQRAVVQSLRDRAERLESEQRQRVEQAREAERLRIAGEMHDVLAHRVSLLSLHAGALEFRPDAPREEVAEAAGVIRTTAHAALEELREVIGVLREGAEGSAPQPPQPTLAQVPALVEESRAAGMRVRCSIDTTADKDLPAALERAAYRVVQEGLTNARKHAPDASVEVTISVDAGERLVVEVVSRGPVAIPAAAAPAEPLPGAGSGLIGLAERVTLAGGELQHGPGTGGDFVLRATLPRQS
jgi:signal transduction histidine kinase